MCGNGVGPDVSAPGSPYPHNELAPVYYDSAPCDSWNNTYTCVRGSAIPSAPSSSDFLYCEFRCFHPQSQQPMPCAGSTASSTGEFYNMTSDPWQMVNAVSQLPPQTKAKWSAMLQAMGACAGQQGCVWSGDV